MHCPRRPQLALAAAAILLALLAATLGLSACGGNDSAKLREKTLTLTERDTDFFSYVDAPPKTKLTADGPERVSNGDQLTYAIDLLDGSKKDVGDADVTCVFTRTTGQPRRGLSAGRFDSSSGVCTGVMTLPGGSLTATAGGKTFAETSQANPHELSIVGGTGRYAGAIGDFKSVGEPAVDTIHVFVPHK